MDLDQIIEEFISWKHLEQSFHVCPDYSETKALISFFKQVESKGNIYPFVWDFYKNDIFYISENFYNYFGFKKEDVLREKLSYSVNRMVPIDALMFIKGSQNKWNHILSRPVCERKNYKMIAEFRMTNDYDKIIRIMSQQVILALSDEGNIWLKMKLFEYAPEQNIETPATISCINITSGNPLFTSKEIKNEIFKSKLSNREVQILQAISKGYFSKQIAGDLLISENTVNNHRRNIIRKLKVSNTSEAVSLARDLDIL